MDDPIIEELHRIRREHAAQFNNDLDAIFADYKRLEAQSTQKLVSLPPRRIKPVERTTSSTCFEPKPDSVKI